MKSIKRIRYNTMSSWNNSTAPAYNMKVYNVINKDLQKKVFEIMDTEEIWYEVNDLIREFDLESDYKYQVIFNGRSNGYLVLIKGGYKDDIIFKEENFKTDNGYKGRQYADGYGWNNYKEAKEKGILNKVRKQIYTQPGINIEDNEVPAEVLKSFRRLAIHIIKLFENTAKNCDVIDKVITIPKTIKVLKCNKQ